MALRAMCKYSTLLTPSPSRESPTLQQPYWYRLSVTESLMFPMRTLLGCTEVSLIMHLCFSDCLLSFSFIVWVRMTLPMCLSFDVCV